MKNCGIIIAILAGLITGAAAQSGRAYAQGNSSPESRLAVIWSSGDPEVAHRAADAAVFRAEVAGDHLELGHGVRRWIRHLARKSLVAGGIGVVVKSVQQEVIVRAPHPVHVERTLAGGVGLAASGDLCMLVVSSARSA